MSEINEIRKRYERRKAVSSNFRNYSFYFSYYCKVERELKYYEILHRKFGGNFSQSKIIEVGAGSGDNLLAFKRMGFEWENIYANELLEDRVLSLKKNLPNSHILPGDASELDFSCFFDVVFQSTVFTSILDKEFKIELANKMFKMAKNCGLILWYDFVYNNPKNPDVMGIKKKEIIELFLLAKKINFYKVTVAPPIGRKIGKLYNFVNFLCPFLRTHIIAEIHK